MNTCNLEMRHLSPSPVHRRHVETVIMAAADYNLLVEGVAPTAWHIDDFFISLPPGMNAADKFTMGFYADDQIVGIADVIRGWNAPHKAIIGLLLLIPTSRGRGVGKNAVKSIEAMARTWPGVDTLRIAVIDNNDAAFVFWRRMGFTETGERHPIEAPYIGAKVVLEKTLQARTPA